MVDVKRDLPSRQRGIYIPGEIQALNSILYDGMIRNTVVFLRADAMITAPLLARG